MGNSQCKPKEGGESLKDFLSRKFNKIAKKRKIDDLVTIAIITETEEGTDGQHDKLDEIELLDIEDEITSECDPDMAPQITKEFEEHRTSFMDVSSEMPFEDNDTIRSLQKQLKEVQDELANLQKGFTSSGLSSLTSLGDGRKYSGCSAELLKNSTEDSVDHEETNGQKSQRNYFHTCKNCDSQAHQLFNVSNENKTIGYFGRREEKGRFQTGERKDNDKQMGAYNGSVKITEGLRTSSKSKQSRTSVTQRNNNYARTAVVDKGALSIEEKIASLQKRDPTALKPDKGIVWPKTMLNLSKADKAYYTEQFMRSELFRQRCLRKYQGSHTWMNGLSPFQMWIVEHEGSEELEAVLHPFPKRRNNAQAKVICWRGNTPPPPPPPKSP